MIDILLATYNGEKYLKEQIESIITQSYKNIHLIIRDDGSSDRTLEIIHEMMKRYPCLITFLDDTSHLGVIGSFSRLLSTSKASYVMFADQDDVWLNHKVLTTFNRMLELEAAMGKDRAILVHGDLKVVDEKLKEKSPSYWSYTRIKPREGSHLNRLLVQNEVTGCTIMVNRPLIDLAIPLFPGSVMHDWWLALVAGAFGHVGLIREPLILYRQHGKNTIGAKRFGSFSKITINQHKKHAQALEFLKRYRHQLTQDNAQMIQDYVSMKESPILRNRYLTLKHGFLKQGLLRNLFYFFLVRHP